MDPIALIQDMDGQLGAFLVQHGPVVYGLVAAMIAFQTAFVVGPILPGNPLLFAVGLVAKQTHGWPGLLGLVLLLGGGAALGNLVNYAQGRFLGERLRGRGPFREDRCVRVEQYFAEQGKKATTLAMFVPFVRAFAPFVAGMSRMPFTPFVLASLLGGVLWTGSFLVAGALLGQVPAVRDHMGILILVVFTLLTLRLAWVAWSAKRAETRAGSVN